MANTQKTQIWSNFNQFAQGDFQGVTLLPSGELELGYLLKFWTKDLPNAVTALLPIKSDFAYVATSAPSQLWEVTPTQKPRLVFELKQPLITDLFLMPNGEMAIVSGPDGGVTFARPGYFDHSRSVGVHGLIFGATRVKDSLVLVGDKASIFQITGAKVTKKPVLSSENQLRSLVKNYYGSANSGTIYQDRKPIFKASGEVVSLALDSKDNLFAAINTSKNASQIWKISNKSSSCLVWESASETIYTLLSHQEKLFWGTGPKGHLFSSKAECAVKPDILLSLHEHHRIMALAPFDSQLLVATAQKGALFSLDLSKKAKSGVFLSPIVKLDAPAKIQTASSPLWLGSTQQRDAYWWNFDSDKTKEAQYAQAQVTLTNHKPINKVYFTYTLASPELKIQSVQVSQQERGVLSVQAELNIKGSQSILEYQFELESLEGEKTIIQPYAKILSVNYDSSKLSKGLYRVLVFSEKDKSHPAGESDWFELLL